MEMRHADHVAFLTQGAGRDLRAYNSGQKISNKKLPSSLTKTYYRINRQLPKDTCLGAAYNVNAY